MTKADSWLALPKKMGVESNIFTSHHFAFFFWCKWCRAPPIGIKVGGTRILSLRDLQICVFSFSSSENLMAVCRANWLDVLQVHLFSQNSLKTHLLEIDTVPAYQFWVSSLIHPRVQARTLIVLLRKYKKSVLSMQVCFNGFSLLFFFEAG